MTKPHDDGPREGEQPVAVEVSDGMLHVRLKDGRVISTPLVWYPRLAAASEAQLLNVELSAYGIHWPELDEDLSIRGMLEGTHPQDTSHTVQHESTT